jgi:hypothetical protein
MVHQPAADDLHLRIPAEAMRLLNIGASRDLTLRISGSLAVRMCCVENAQLLDTMGRRPLRDIDYWGYSKEQTQLESLFEEQGYLADPTIKQAHEWGVKRLIYQHPDTHIKIDVFMDELVMAHTIEFKNRLGLASSTVSVTDLLLSKLQIHEITENDLKDLIVLFTEYGCDDNASRGVDLGYIVDRLRKDWGFCYTALDNLEKCEKAIPRYPALSTELGVRVRQRLATMREQIESAPKTSRWKLRSRLGTRARWYEEVQEVDR